MVTPVDPGDSVDPGSPAGPGAEQGAGPAGPKNSAPAAAPPVGVGRADRPAIGWTEIGVSVVTYLVLQIAVGVVLFLIYRGPPPGIPLAALAAISAGGAVAVAAAVRVRSPAALGLRRPSGRALLLGVGAGVLAWGLARGIIIGYVSATGDLSNPQAGFAATASASTVSLLGLLAVGALLVPLGEEVLFRGVLFAGLRRYGLTVAVVLSAVLFGAAHGLNVVGITAAVLGVLNALLYDRTRSIWPAVVAHAINNTIVFVSAAVLLG